MDEEPMERFVVMKFGIRGQAVMGSAPFGGSLGTLLETPSGVSSL